MALKDLSPNRGQTPGAQTPPAPPSSPLPPIGARPPKGSILGGGGEGFDPESILIDYAKYKDEPPILFRDAVIDQALAILISLKKRNPLLVGAPGTGKTAIPQEIARRIAKGDPRIPPELKGSRILELPLSALVAGSSLVGSLEEKVQAVIDFACDEKNNVIIFIDEIHQLAGGPSPVHKEIAQILKPAMATGEIRVIGATTTQEATNLMADPAFNRRFGRVIVDELTPEQTIEIGKEHIKRLEAHHGFRVAIDPAILPTAMAIANRYGGPGSHRPDNLLTITDRAVAATLIERARLEARAASAEDPTLRAQLLSALQASPKAVLSTDALRKSALRLRTGNSVQPRIGRAELKGALAAVQGQERALSELTDAIIRRMNSPFAEERPLSILACGDSGNGKTETAKVLAKTLCATRPIALNMAEYSDDSATHRIIGAPAGYVGYSDADELPFDALEANPYQVIILDEFEKASRAVQRLFMGVLEEGTLKTSRGKEVDFTHAIVIATTNAAHAAHATHALGFGEATDPAESRQGLVDALSRFFDVELINRFDLVLRYEPISKGTYASIVAALWEKLSREVRAEYPQVPEQAPEETVKAIVDETYVKAFGARPARRAVKAAIERLIQTP